MNKQRILSRQNAPASMPEQYDGILRDSSRALGGSKAKSSPAFSELGIPGLASLVATFPNNYRPLAYSFGPYAQIPFFAIEHSTPRREELHFEMIAQCARMFLSVVSDVVHAALWEPLFTGDLEIETREQFKSLCQGLLGIDAWFRLQRLAPAIRNRAPRAEIFGVVSGLANDIAVSSRAFALVGASSVERSLPFYVNAYQGKPTPGFTAEFRRRFESQQKRSISRDVADYKDLKAVGLFGDFVETFCRIEGLPSIYPSEVLRTLQRDGATAYGFAVLDRGLPAVSRMSPKRIEAVRWRRALQTRAHLGLQLRYLLETKEFTAAAGFDAQASLASTNRFLESIHETLVMLAHGAGPSQLRRRCDALDDQYARQLQKSFAAFKVRGTFGSGEIKSKPSLLGNYLRNSFDFVRSPGLSAQLARDAAQASTSRRVQKVVGHDLLAERWSPSLSTISPRDGVFLDLMRKL